MSENDKEQQVKEQINNKEQYSENNSNETKGKVENLNDGMEYMLFLILILLLLGNQNSFTEYFRLLEHQTSDLQNFLNTFSATAEGLKSAITTPQKIFNENK